MKRAVDAAREFYRPELAVDEDVRSVHLATAGGTGSKVATGSLIGGLAGWFLAVTPGFPVLPLLVMSALIGVAVSYLLAEREARRPEGPGTIHLELVVTSQNLLAFRRFPATRLKVLRRYPLGEITDVAVTRYPIADYHRYEIMMAAGTRTAFVVDGELDLTS